MAMELKEGFYAINQKDNVATALADITVGEVEIFGAVAQKIRALENISFGHKIALRDIKKGEDIVKYSYAIGSATEDIGMGACVDTRNCVSKIGVSTENEVYRPGTKTKYDLLPYMGGEVRKDG